MLGFCQDEKGFCIFKKFKNPGAKWTPAGHAAILRKRHCLSFSTYTHINPLKYGFYVDKCVYIVYKRQFFCTLKLTLINFNFIKSL